MSKRIAITYVAPGLLKPNPWNSNVVGPEMEARLEASVDQLDIYKPIIVRELPDGSLQILGGEHRARVANKKGIAEVPIVNLGRIDDLKAKKVGLADNGRYGEDDSLKLAAILREIGDVAVEFLPFTEQDLAGIFAAEEIDLDSIGMSEDADEPEGPATPATRATITHELMRFKVPVADRERVQKLIERVTKLKGLANEKDSMIAAGMALVELVNLAEAALA
jgi:ParB-like chromosome segregation protein Spo0J